MTKLLQTLLMGIVLLLCGLCAAQWMREAKFRNEIKSLKEQVEGVSKELGLTKAAHEAVREEMASVIPEMNRLQETNKFLTSSLQTTQRELTQKKHEAEQLHEENKLLQQAIEERNSQLKELHGKMLQTMTERNEIVSKSNEVIEKHNQVVQQYNALAAQLQKLQTNSGKTK